MLSDHPNSPSQSTTPRVLDDAESILHDARESVRRVMDFIAADAIATGKLLDKKCLEIALEGITECYSWEGNVAWANDVVKEHASDASLYPDADLCDELQEQVYNAFRVKSGEDFTASLIASLKPTESLRKPPTNPATTGRVAVRSGDGVQFIEYGE